MNKTTEALKLAEEALEELHYSSGTVKAVTLYKSALDAIREARAEQDHIADAGKVIAEPVKQEPVACVPTLTSKELSALQRFLETSLDNEGYDVPKQMMKRLAEIGVVTHTSRGIYFITEFGNAVLNGITVNPVKQEPVAIVDVLALAKELGHPCPEADAAFLEDLAKNIADAGKVIAEPVKQEPVASVVAMLDKCISIIGTEMNHCKQAGDKWFMCQRFIHAIQDMQYEFKRDYAAPVKREWVDLTEADVEKIKGFYSQASFETIVRAVITAFKEKNK